jgi:DNA-directed RNA polymerase specialized sigma24 family protein
MKAQETVLFDCLLADARWFSRLRRALATVDDTDAPSHDADSTSAPVNQADERPSTLDRTNVLDLANLRLALLDAVLALAEPERSSVILRFIEGRDLAAVARLTRVSPEEALERARRGIEDLVSQGHRLARRI